MHVGTTKEFILHQRKYAERVDQEKDVGDHEYRLKVFTTVSMFIIRQVKLLV